MAVEAVCHERSVTRYLSGARMDNNTRLRIEAALRKLKFSRAIRVELDTGAACCGGRGCPTCCPADAS